jgi:hypothetical protein
MDRFFSFLFFFFFLFRKVYTIWFWHFKGAAGLVGGGIPDSSPHPSIGRNNGHSFPAVFPVMIFAGLFT